jgi:hypothetical protein
LWNFHLACYQAVLGEDQNARCSLRRALALDPRLSAMAARNSNLSPLMET